MWWFSMLFGPKGQYEEQRNGFLVLGCRTPMEEAKFIGCLRTEQEAEDFARQKVKDGRFDFAFIVPTSFTCGVKPN